MKKSLVPLFLLVFLAVQNSCGVYSFSSSGKPAFNSVYVTQFENQTIEYQLADRITDAVIDAFIRDNAIEIKDAATAEAVMTGTMTQYRRDAETYDANDNVESYSLTVTVAVKVVRPNTEDIIWEENFIEKISYNAASETEEDGQQKIIDRLTGDILDRTTKNW